MELTLDSMALEMPEVSGHPNRMPFRGVLTYLDQPSDRPPAGARGHRVVLTRAAAEKALPSLLGMAVDFTPSLDGHDAQRKVGVITSAEIVGKAIEVQGHLFARDFPELAQELAAHAGQLGMSYEVADARVENMRARIWRLTQVSFTGAAILRKNKAAYQNTSFALIPKASGDRLQASLRTKTPETCTLKPETSYPKGTFMNPELMQQFTEAGARLAAAAEAIEQSVQRLDAKLEAQHKSLSEKLEKVTATLDDASSDPAPDSEAKTLYERVVELEKQNAELKAQSSRAASGAGSGHALRKTLPPTVSALLAKNGVESGERVEIATLDRILAPLSIEQRIAVKDQMAQAGMIA